MRLFVVRHYRTCSNASGRIMGWGDSPPAADWERDLLAVDQVFNETGLRFDAVYSSGLARARHSAEFLAVRQGVERIRSSVQINEINYGSLYDKPKDWVRAHFPQYKTDPDFVYPGGESFRQMQARSARFVLDLQRRHQGQTLLLVAHAGVIRGLVCHFLELPYAEHLKRKVSHRYVGCFSIEGGRCTRYEEYGVPSGFVADAVVHDAFRGRDFRSTGGGGLLHAGAAAAPNSAVEF